MHFRDSLAAYLQEKGSSERSDCGDEVSHLPNRCHLLACLLFRFGFWLRRLLRHHMVYRLLEAHVRLLCLPRTSLCCCQLTREREVKRPDLWLGCSHLDVWYVVEHTSIKALSDFLVHNLKFYGAITLPWSLSQVVETFVGGRPLDLPIRWVKVEICSARGCKHLLSKVK